MDSDIRCVFESEKMIHEDRNHTKHINSCFDGTQFCEAKKHCCESEDERGYIRVIDEDRINNSIKIKGKRGAGLYSRVPMKGVFLVPQHAHHNMNQILECMPHESVAHTHLCVGSDNTSVSEKIFMLESIMDVNIELQSSERESPEATLTRQESHLNSKNINKRARTKRTRRTLYNEEYVVFCTGNERIKKSHMDSSQTEYMKNCRQEIAARTFCNVESMVSCTPNKKTKGTTSKDHVPLLNQSDQVEKFIKKKENGMNLEIQMLCKRSNDTEARILRDTAPMGRDRELKELARNLARKVLLDSGFKLEFRQRKEKDYQDPVYRSPEGHTHWSLPKAWRAFKELQAKGLIEDSKMKYGLVKADKSAIILVFSRFGKKMEVALRNKGCLSGTCLEISEAEVTNAELIDILLEDLGILNKFVNTTKLQKKQRNGKAKKPHAKDIKQCRSTSPDDLDNKGKTKISKLKDIIDIGVLPSVDYVHGRGRKLISLNESRTSSKSQARFVLKQTEKNMMLTSRASNSPNVCNKFVKSGNKQRILKEFLMKKGYFKSAGPKKQKGLSKKITNLRAHSDVQLQARPSSLSDNSGSEGLLCQTRCTLFSWMIDRNVIVERERIFCKDPKSRKVLKEGVVTRDGILCKCCKKVHTTQSFRDHSGNMMGDSPQDLVFASGKSLLDCQLDAWNAEVHLTKTFNYVGVTAEDPNDDSCTICGDGGDLICCDRCPSTFHASCLLLDNVPEGDWCCPKCRCVACGGPEHNVKRELLMVVCKQCKHRYHVSCMNGKCNMVDHTYFCGDFCEKVYVGLRGFNGVAHPLDGGLEWTFLRCSDIKSNSNETRVQVEHNSKLAMGLLVIRECFNPMVDPRTNIDMIAQAVYNRWCEFDRLNYADFYTLVLEDNGEVVSVASIRVHGTRLAEMPLICTRHKYRRKGMCKLVLGIIEKILGSLGVATLILPAIPETLATWTNAFGFRPLDPAQKEAIINFSMMMFPGTELLQKHIQSIDAVSDNEINLF